MTQEEEKVELDTLPADVNEINSLLQSILLVLSQNYQSLFVVHHIPQIRLYPSPESCLFSQALQTQLALSLAYLPMSPQSFFSYYNYCYDVPLQVQGNINFVLSLFHQLQY